MLETLIVILVLLWLLGFFGPRVVPRIPRSGNLIHVLLIIILVLVIIRLL